jgi:ubiquinone/menaquinone biosynthesis C-methylase UbiE
MTEPDSDADRERRDCLEQWDAAADGWDKGAVWMRERAAAVSHWLIDAIEPQPGQQLLELAAGPGETGFLAAELVAPGGTLICSDQSEAMLEVARTRATELGLTNVTFRVINAESIDLPVASVDGVLCRWGYMLMVDPLAAFVETRRVLKPGGRVSLACWAEPAANQWLALPRAVLIEHGLAEPSPPDAPGPFALSDPQRLRALLEDAGFGEIEVDAVDLDFGGGSFDEWWEIMLQMSPVGAALRAATPELRRAVAADVAKRLDADRTARTLVALASA